MAGDRTLFEKDHPNRAQQSFGFAFGRITAVYASKRLCQVKTFMGSGPFQDNHLPKCQWISMDAHPDGDESNTIPRVGSYGLVFYIAGEPFIFGFFSPLIGTADAEDNQEQLNEGDRIIKTIGGNKIILRAGGIIEVDAGPTCYTIYFPNQALIRTMCQNYMFTADGGTINWLNIDNNNDTYFAQEFRDNIARNNVIIEERGYIDSGSFVSRTTIGAGGPNGTITQSVWTQTIKPDGTTNISINPPGATNGFTATIAPTGATTLNIGGGAVTFAFTPDGKITATSKSDVSLTTGGAVTVTASGSAKIKASDITLDGGGDLEEVLTTPSAISDFTGAPIQAGSSKVKATGASG